MPKADYNKYGAPKRFKGTKYPNIFICSCARYIMRQIMVFEGAKELKDGDRFVAVKGSVEGREVAYLVPLTASLAEDVIMLENWHETEAQFEQRVAKVLDEFKAANLDYSKSCVVYDTDEGRPLRQITICKIKPQWSPA